MTAGVIVLSMMATVVIGLAVFVWIWMPDRYEPVKPEDDEDGQAPWM